MQLRCDLARKTLCVVVGCQHEVNRPPLKISRDRRHPAQILCRHVEKLKGIGVVDANGVYRVGLDLNPARQCARAHRLSSLELLILSTVSEVRKDQGDSSRSCLRECILKEEEFYGPGVRMGTLYEDDILSFDGIEEADVLFSVREAARMFLE